jgi:N,N'-diacetylchitobiose transport system substrate-binding protein
MSAFGVAGMANHFFLPMIWQAGGEIAKLQDGKWVSSIDSPPAAKAIQFYADLYSKEHFAPAGALSWNSRDVRAAFEAGDLAMMIGGGWDVQAMLTAHPEMAGKIGTALLPAGPSGNRDAFAGGSHLVIFKDSKHQDLARRYTNFMLEPRRVSAFAAKLGFLPGSLEALRASPGDGIYTTFTDQLEHHSRTYPPSNKWGSFEGANLFSNAVQQVMKGTPAAAALREVEQTMNKAFAES